MQGKTFKKLGLIGAAGLSAFLFTGTAATAAPASGDSGVKYDRKSKKTRSNIKLDTKFKKQKAAEKKARERKVNMMAGAAFAKKRAAVAQEMADTQIGMLKRLIKTTDKSDAEYPDLLFRLANHYLEKKSYFDLQSGKLYEDIYDAEDANNKAKVKQLKDKQKRFKKDAKDGSLKASRVYAALVNDPAFASFKRMDEALYYYAYELGELGKETEMQAAYQQLINSYPNSQYISQAYLAFADYYFDKNKIQNAIRLYEKVTQFKDSPVYAYALYKLAWCHLNPIGTAEARFDKSLDYFVATIRATIEGRAGSEANAKQLRRDARRDLVRAYVHASRPSKAWDFFGKWGVGPQKDENDQRRMMTLLANQYFGDGQYVESTYIYKQLQNHFDGDADICEWQGRIVVNTLATDNKEVQWKETDKLGQIWSEYKDGSHKKAVKRKCRDDARDTIHQMASVWHDEAEKTKLPRTYELAELAYGGYLSVFPAEKDAYKLRYYYGELLWAMAENNWNMKDDASREKAKKQFRKANEVWVSTLEADPKGKFTTDSAYGQMLAMKNALDYDETGGKKKSCKTNSEGVCVYREKKKKKAKADKNTKLDAAALYPESDYTDAENSMLGAYDVYVKYVTKKDDKELPKIMYHRAKLMMIHNKFEEAKPLLEEIITTFDGVSKAQIYAAWCSEMLLDLLTIRWVDTNNSPEQTVTASEELELWAKKFKKMKVWNNPEASQVKEAVPILLSGIGWKKGMAYRDAGAAFVKGEEYGDADGFKKCADQFIQVYNDYEAHDRADTLLWNAADCLDAAYMVGKAIQIRKILLDRHSDSKHAKDTLHFLAGSYQAVAYYADAAQRYEQFAESYKKDKRASDALQNAYLFRLGLGEQEKAAENLKKYEGVYKRKNVAKAAKIFWSRHGLIKEDAERRKHAEEYLKTYGSKGGKDRKIVAEAVVAQIDWRRSCAKELVQDSCMSIKRKRVISGVEEIERRKKLEARQARAEKKRKREKFKPPARCGSATQGIITVHKRDKKQAAAAQKRFSSILKLVGKGEMKIPAEDLQRADAFRNAWGMAMVYRADKEYEEYMTLEMPSNLDFNVEEWKNDPDVPKWKKEYDEQVKTAADSKKRFGEFFEKKKKLSLSLTEQYAKVKGTGSPAWILAAAARSASVQQNFSDQLYRAEVPSSFKTQESVWAYCDALADFAQPLEKEALDAFTYCIDRSTKFQYFNEFSRLCEDEMQQRDAERYPATNESFGTSTYTASKIEHVDVFTDADGSRRSAVKRKTAAAGGAKDDEATN